MKMIIFIILLIVLLFSGAYGNDQAPVPAAKTMQAVRLTDKVTIDGLLDEPDWKRPGCSEFIQLDPNEGQNPSETTEVWVGFDENNLYVAARLHDSEPGKIGSLLGRRDDFLDSDWFFVFLDPSFDRRSGYRFGVNPAGSVMDSRISNDVNEDYSWDAVWDSKAVITPEGWAVEMCIPLNQIRFPKKAEYTWGVDIRRIIKRKNERQSLVLVKRDEVALASRFALLEGLKGITPKGRIELWPYLVGQAAFTPRQEGNPFQTGNDYLGNAGLDLKWAMKSNLTLDAAINPDYGQVEVDPAVINLSAYETYFEEKRPFFIEGGDMFNGFGRGGLYINANIAWPSPTFFYSRRIGRTPRGQVNGDGYADYPDRTTILSAFKLSGKLGSNWNIGWVNAFTAREYGHLDTGFSREQEEVEPFTYYGTLRLQRDFNQGMSGIGLISTITARDLRTDQLQGLLNRNAFTAAVDGWKFLDKKKSWVIGGWLGGTSIGGSPESILRLQRSALHYFQRPDADHLRLDPNATSLSGWGGRLVLNKQQGNFIMNLALGALSPGFDPNDAGFQYGSSDRINGHALFLYQWTKPGKVFRSAQLFAGAFRNQDFDGNRTWEGILFNAGAELLNYWRSELMLAYNPATISNDLTRGGPLAVTPHGYQADLNISSDNRKKLVLGFFSGLYNRPDDGLNWNGELSLRWKPKGNISLSIGPAYSVSNTETQWIKTVADPLMSDTFGSRYVFGRLRQKVISSVIRINWIFNPRLSLQVYLQPFIAVGRFDRFKEFSRPKTYDYRLYGSDGFSTLVKDNGEYTVDPDGSGAAGSFSFADPDFNVKSLRGTVVLRWEYRPGSLFYLVWTQNRADYANPGEFRLGRDLGDLFAAKGDNIFMMKFTYRWNW